MNAPVVVSLTVLVGALLLALCSLVFGALALGLWIGERARNRDLRLILGAPASGGETPGVYHQESDEPEDAAGRGLPAQIRPEEIEAGAKDIMTMAKAYDLEISPEAAREQALAMLAQGQGLTS